MCTKDMYGELLKLKCLQQQNLRIKCLSQGNKILKYIVDIFVFTENACYLKYIQIIPDLEWFHLHWIHWLGGSGNLTLGSSNILPGRYRPVLWPYILDDQFFDFMIVQK